jgi:integrase
LAAAVPIVANRSMPSIPRAIGAEQVPRLLASIDRHTVIGRRDYAIVLLLARLGLRSGEVAFLEIEDINWDAGQVSVRGKRGHRTALPLPADVGAAIAAYLRHGRPRSTSRRVFLRSKAPIRGFLGQCGVGSIVQHALQRAGIQAPTRGAHRFRHARATRLLRHGASLTEIGDALRHRSPQTTTIYAKVDLKALRTLALPWPEVRDDCASAGRAGVRANAARSGIQAASGGQRISRFHAVHGATPRVPHHTGVGAGLGATTIACSTGTLGSAADLCPRICTLPQRDRSTHADPGTQPVAIPAQAEIRNLLRAALALPCRYERGKLRPWVYYCLLGLLSVSGLRVGEARNLELQDVDLKAATLTIRGTKFGKTRLVPMHGSTCSVLTQYIRRS